MWRGHPKSGTAVPRWGGRDAVWYGADERVCRQSVGRVDWHGRMRCFGRTIYTDRSKCWLEIYWKALRQEGKRDIGGGVREREEVVKGAPFAQVESCHLVGLPMIHRRVVRLCFSKVRRPLFHPNRFVQFLGLRGVGVEIQSKMKDHFLIFDIP